MSANRQAYDERREIHARVARLRRRLSRRAERISDGGLLFGSWRSYVQQYPARSLAMAAGAGLLASSITGRNLDGTRFGDRLCQLATGGTLAAIGREIERFLAARPAATDPLTETHSAEAGDE